MENVELALKNTNRNEKALTGGAQNSDDFSVDDLLDFSNDDVFVEDDEAELKLQQRKKGVSVSLNDENTLRRSNGFSTAVEDFGSLLHTSELSVPMDDIAELEWLSNFVEDSFTPCSLPTKKPVWLTGNRRHSVAPVKEETCFKAPLPVRRSKRARIGVRDWSLIDSSSTSSATSSSSSSGPSSPLWLSGAEFLDDSMVKRQKKKKMKKESEVWENDGQTQTQTRRCSHCGVQETPQWRGGPLGAKTLCNACGMRFKTGRLLSEYRPACSPTFSSELHSNHHRKVIEMRLKKETSDEADNTGLKFKPVGSGCAEFLKK